MLPTELTLIGFGDSPGFQEHYSGPGHVVYTYNGSHWLVAEYDVSKHTKLLDSLREAELTKHYDSGYPARLIVATGAIDPGLSHCILPDHRTIIVGYLEAIIPCPMPIPAENFHKVCQNHVNLEGFIIVSDVVLDWQSDDWELWVVPSSGLMLECKKYARLTWWENHGASLQRCSPLFNILFSTLRNQILGLPLR